MKEAIHAPERPRVKLSAKTAPDEWTHTKDAYMSGEDESTTALTDEPYWVRYRVEATLLGLVLGGTCGVSIGLLTVALCHWHHGTHNG